MQIEPNRTLVDGVVTKITPQADGFGCELEVDVHAIRPARGNRDFLGATTGDSVTLFMAKEQPVILGKAYRIAATVLGGPSGGRNVVESLRLDGRVR